jgi:hypothetical protein
VNGGDGTRLRVALDATPLLGPRTGIAPSPPSPPDEAAPTIRRRHAARRFVRRHAAMAVLLLAGLVLRALTTLAYRPAMQFVQDSLDYLHDAEQLVPGVVRPLGYPLFLRALSVTGRLGVVPVVQHLLGLIAGVLLYALLRRLGARSWMAALGAAPILLDGYQVYLEQFVLAETLFVVLVVGALVALLWADRPPPVVCAGAGTLLAAAALTRTVGVLLLVPAAGYVVVRRLGVRRLAALLVPATVLLGGYAVWFHAEHGEYRLVAYEGYFLAGRVSPFADCASLDLPPEEEALCDDRPLAERPGADWYSFMPGSPLRDPQGPTGIRRNAVARSFARRVIRNQPGDYARTVATDVVRYFSPSRTSGPGDYPVEMLHFRTEYTPQPWQPLYPPADPYVDAWTWPGPAMSYGTLLAAHGFGMRELHPSLDAALAGRLRTYQRYGYTPGPVLALALAVGLLGGCGRLPATRRRLRWAAFTFAACGVLALLAAAAAAGFDYRLLMPTLALLPPSGVMGATLMEQRLRTRREEVGDGGKGAPTHAGDGSGSPSQESPVA